MKELVCVFWRGTVEPICAAGLCPRQVVGGDDVGWVTRAPCFGGGPINQRANGPVATCSKYRQFTAEEIAAYKQAIADDEKRFARCEPLFAEIKAKHGKGVGGAGTANCPACGSGTIRWTCAKYNGHLHVSCSTSGCIRFME